MGAQMSILKGAQINDRPRLLHKVFEENVDTYFGEKTALIFNGNFFIISLIRLP